MSRRFNRGTWWLAAASGLVVAAGLCQGSRAAGGAALGVLGVGFSVYGTWLAVRWVGRMLAEGSPGWQGAAAPIAALVIKLPLVLGSMMAAQRLGPPAPAWYLAGLALVYSALVWWAVARQ